jgi:hypothetical protein
LLLILLVIIIYKMSNSLLKLKNILIWIIYLFGFVSSKIFKSLEIIENPRALQQNTTLNKTTMLAVNSTISNSTLLTSAEVEQIRNFHKLVKQIQYQGEWKKEARNNSFFDNPSGLMKMQVFIYAISANGRQIQINFMIQDGIYRDKWYMFEQDYLYFYNGDADSDITYTVTDTDIVLHDKNKDYRHSVIKAYNLFHNYRRYDKYYFDNLDIHFLKATPDFDTLTGYMYFSDLLIDIRFDLVRQRREEVTYTSFQYGSVMLILTMCYLINNVIFISELLTSTFNSKSVSMFINLVLYIDDIL